MRAKCSPRPAFSHFLGDGWWGSCFAGVYADLAESGRGLASSAIAGRQGLPVRESAGAAAQTRESKRVLEAVSISAHSGEGAGGRDRVSLQREKCSLGRAESLGSAQKACDAIHSLTEPMFDAEAWRWCRQ